MAAAYLAPRRDELALRPDELADEVGDGAVRIVPGRVTVPSDLETVLNAVNIVRFIWICTVVAQLCRPRAPR